MPISLPVEQLGAELRRRRSARPLRDLEEEIGVSASTLSRIERGHVPDLNTVHKVAEWLGVTVRTGAPEGGTIESDADLLQAIEVHLRAKKQLPEEAARAIADAVKHVMEWEIEKVKRSSER